MKKSHKKYIIEHCLKYSLHRLERHKEAGIGKAITKEELKELIVSIGFKNKKNN